jgi:hypothetical protein
MDYQKVKITKDCKFTVQDFDEYAMDPDRIYKKKFKQGDIIDGIKTINPDPEDDSKSIFRMKVDKFDDEIKFLTMYDINNSCYSILKEDGPLP